MDQANTLRDRIRLREEKKQQQSVTDKQKKSRVIAVTSGKGGVGKSNIALNLSIFLSLKSQKVIIIDVDFGLANVEILFGVSPAFSLTNVFFGDKSIEEIICNGPNDIDFISAGTSFKELANISPTQINHIIKGFSFLDNLYDFIIIDTGAGMSNSVLNFVMASEEIFVVTTPEPTSITDAYSVIKAVSETSISLPKINLIVNKVEDENEGKEVFKKLQSVSAKFLGRDVEDFGYIPEDKCLVKAVKLQRPVATCFPNSEVSKAIDRICLQLMNENIDESSIGVMRFAKKFLSIFKD